MHGANLDRRAALSAGIAALFTGRLMPPVYAAALTGALLGFLRLNFPPAKIFLGDSGSLVVGFLLAFVTVRGAMREDGAVYALVPLFSLSYPLMDTAVAMMRRWLRGDPLSRADGRHIHHQLRALGLGQRRSLAIICLTGFAIAILGLSLTFAPAKVTLALAIAGGTALAFLFVFVVRWLEYHELLEAGSVVATAVPRARGAIRETIYARDLAKGISKIRSRTQLDLELTVSAARFGFTQMEIGSVGSASRLSDTLPSPLLWKFEYPIIDVDGVPALDQLGEILTLRIWSPTRVANRSASAARVAQVIAPAIAVWISVNGSGVVDPEPRRARRSSGSHRAVVDRTLVRRSSREVDAIVG
jgi:UDP-GlcNAc:undecaprenyl-phosphate GlcNAc-1-phosphate transferase